jgi:2-methylcitrate dehydratase PrpD
LIKANRVSAADVDTVVVRLDRVGSKTVNNRSMPDINLQYLASVMLLDGTLTLAAAHDVVRMRDPQVVALMQRVELIDDEEMTRALPARHAVVEVKLRDGRELRQLTTQVRGTPGNPVTREEVAEKTLDLCAPVLGKARARELIEAVWQIEKVTNVRKLRPLLRA